MWVLCRARVRLGPSRRSHLQFFALTDNAAVNSTAQYKGLNDNLGWLNLNFATLSVRATIFIMSGSPAAELRAGQPPAWLSAHLLSHSSSGRFTSSHRRACLTPPAAQQRSRQRAQELQHDPQLRYPGGGGARVPLAGAARVWLAQVSTDTRCDHVASARLAPQASSPASGLSVARIHYDDPSLDGCAASAAPAVENAPPAGAAPPRAPGPRHCPPGWPSHSSSCS
jgi:hypothetical protein